MNLEDILHKKTVGLIYVKASDTVLQAMQTMCDNHVGAILIQSDDGQLLGIATERDILRFTTANQGIVDDALINEAMTYDLVVATPDYSVDEAMSLMTELRFRHLPVMKNGKPIGLVSIGDLVKAKLKDAAVEVKYLRDYISA